MKKWAVAEGGFASASSLVPPLPEMWETIKNAKEQQVLPLTRLPELRTKQRPSLVQGQAGQLLATELLSKVLGTTLSPVDISVKNVLLEIAKSAPSATPGSFSVPLCRPKRKQKEYHK